MIGERVRGTRRARAAPAGPDSAVGTSNRLWQRSNMTVTIPEELDEFVRAKLTSGGFESPAAVVAAALTAWQGQEVYRSIDRDEVGQLLLQAIDSPRVPWDEANSPEPQPRKWAAIRPGVASPRSL